MDYITGLLLAITIGFFLGKISTDEAWKDIQVENGNAEWILKPATGKTWFRIIPHKNAK